MKKEILTQPPVSHDFKKSKKGKELPADVEMTDNDSTTAEADKRKDADLLTYEGKQHLFLNINDVYKHLLSSN